MRNLILSAVSALLLSATSSGAVGVYAGDLSQRAAFNADAGPGLAFESFETPFDIGPDDWSDLSRPLTYAKEKLTVFNPSGYTIGWNVGVVAGST